MLFFDLFRNEPDLCDVAPGEFLFREGEKADCMYVLVSGKGQVLVGDQVVEEPEAGAPLGEQAMIDDEPRSASVKAISECVFARIDRKRFHFLVSQTPHFATEVMRTMSGRLRNADRLLRSMH